MGVGYSAKNQTDDTKFHHRVVKAPFAADIYDRCVEDEGHVLIPRVILLILQLEGQRRT
jgi:hypothetical protein